MHRTTKRLASALLAAALCFAAALPAGADYEPWTYEVDDVMSTYGVEYYGDVGFDLPKKSTGTASYSADTTSPVTYAAEDGTAVYEENSNTTTVENSYTVTIPAEVSVSNTTDSGTLEISGKVEEYGTLNITVSSENKYTLKCGDSTSYTMPYSITLSGKTNATVNDKTFTVDTDDAAKDFSGEIGITIGDKSNATVSGDYTDRLIFNLSCAAKTYAVVYHANGGTGTMDNTVFTCGNAATLAENAYTKTGYHFAGWTKTSTACITHDEIEYADQKSNIAMSDFTLEKATSGSDYVVNLYAQWGYKYDVEVDSETVNEEFLGDYKNVHSIILMPNETYSWTRTDPDQQNPLAWEPLTTTVTNISADTTEKHEVKRKRYYIDMNGSGPGISGGNLGTAATAQIYVNGKLASVREDHPDGYLNDFWVKYPWGSTFRIVLKVNEGYEVTGIHYDNLTKDAEGYDCGRLTGTHPIGSNNEPASAVTVVFSKTTTDAVSLLPKVDESRPVAITMPDAADDTTADDNADTDSKTTSKADDTTGKTADTSDDTVTPDDLMITDADEMLTILDAAFAVPDFDPVY